VRFHKPLITDKPDNLGGRLTGTMWQRAGHNRLDATTIRLGTVGTSRTTGEFAMAPT
jgi:hypothetical protein